MKSSFRNQGSALVTVLLFGFLLTAIVGGLIALTLQSYHLEKINEARGTERAIAESELEEIYYQFKTALSENKSVDYIPSLISSNFCDYEDPSGNTLPPANTSGTIRTPFLPIYQNAGWTVTRSLSFILADKLIGSIGATGHSGHNYYMTAKVEVIPPTALQNQGVHSFRIGRQLVYSFYTIIQYGLFYEGDIEIETGTTFDIKGDISTNGSIYMGAANDKSTPDLVRLNLFGTVSYVNNYNTDSSNNPNVFFKPGYYSTPLSSSTEIDAPKFQGSGHAKQATGTTDFLGGLSAYQAEQESPALFPNNNDNLVYQSIITPPPYLYDSSGNLTVPNTADYGSTPPAENTTVAAARLYNQASVIITVQGSTATVQELDANGIPQASTTYAGAVSAPTNVYDQREGRNVAVTNIDVSKLMGLQTDPNFQGVIYVNQVQPNPSTPVPLAIRLINGATVPQRNITATDSTGNESDPVGFTIATNGGVYIQGDYNTTPSSSGTNYPTVILGDAVTALSSGWNDTLDTTTSTGNGTGARVASGSLTINTAIVTGNTPTTPISATQAQYTSGGAQNLVRYLEDWSGQVVTLNGSLGCLFASKYFTGAYFPPSLGHIYTSPTRNISFDTNLAVQTPHGAPTIKSYSRGSYFSY